MEDLTQAKVDLKTCNESITAGQHSYAMLETRFSAHLQKDTAFLTNCSQTQEKLASAIQVLKDKLGVSHLDFGIQVQKVQTLKNRNHQLEAARLTLDSDLKKANSRINFLLDEIRGANCSGLTNMTEDGYLPCPSTQMVRVTTPDCNILCLFCYSICRAPSAPTSASLKDLNGRYGL
jgi:cell division protein FtsB